MRHFKMDAPKIEGHIANFTAISDSHRVTIMVERKDEKDITEKEAKTAYSEALILFPQMKHYGS